MTMQAPTPGDPAAPETVADEIAARYAAAVSARDLDAFRALYAPDVQVFDAWNRFVYEGGAAWGGMAERWFASLGEERVEASVRRLGVLGAGELVAIVALVTYSARSPAGEMLRAMDSRLTWLAARREGRWCVVHEHTSNPLDDATFKGVMQLPPGG